MLFVSEHLSICVFQMNPKFYIFPFYKMCLDSTSFGRAKENYFMKLLKPKLKRVTSSSPPEYSVTKHIFQLSNFDYNYYCFVNYVMTRAPSRNVINNVKSMHRPPYCIVPDDLY